MNNHLATNLAKNNRTADATLDGNRPVPSVHGDRAHRTRACIGLVGEMKSPLFGLVPSYPSSEEIDQELCTVAPKGLQEGGALTSYPDAFLREKQVIVVTGLSRSSIWAFGNPKSRYHDPTFPRPIKLGFRAVGWKASEVFLWVASRMPEA